MRKSVVFLILWSLLCLGRLSQLTYCYNQYRISASLESLFALPPAMAEEDKQAVEKLIQNQGEWLAFAMSSCVELALLGGVGWIFFRTNKQANLVLRQP